MKEVIKRLPELVVAVDAMGGDYGPSVTVPATLRSLKHHPTLRIILVGNQNVLEQELSKHSNSISPHPHLKIHHASECVNMDESVIQAVRRKKDSSLRVAINLVREGIAKACVSAGNTGALMAIASLVLKTLPGIHRPAIMANFPTENGQGVRVLDLGANINSSANDLYQFAVMGSVMAFAVDGIERPRVALLNIGHEEIKGNNQVKLTAEILSKAKEINYIGYVEGNDIFHHAADVIVCDGFVGNVALKTCEGLAALMIERAKQEFAKNWLTQLTGLLAKPILWPITKTLDPNRKNGASLLGLQGIVIKSHGNANILAYSMAIEEAVMEVERNVVNKIAAQVSKMLNDSEIV